MPTRVPVTVSAQLKRMPATVRPTFAAARRMVKAIAPHASELAYQSEPPRSSSAMWKIARYAADGESVVGIGVFSRYATLFFYRGRELDHGTGLLEGGGKDLRFVRLHEPADVARPAVKRLVRSAFALAKRTPAAS